METVPAGLKRRRHSTEEPVGGTCGKLGSPIGRSRYWKKLSDRYYKYLNPLKNVLAIAWVDAYPSDEQRWGQAMYDQQRSAALAATLRSAELASMVIRALRARLLRIPLEDRDRESLSGGLTMVEDALRASRADNPEAVAAAAFSGDSKSLRQLREVSADVAVDESRLHKLRDILQKVRDDEVTVSDEDIDKTLWLFARLNSRSLDASRSLQMARRPKKLAASSR